MTTASFDGTIDWNDYWLDADDEDRKGASPSARFALEPLREFLAARDPPASVADVGCGTGSVAFDVARRYPERFQLLLEGTNLLSYERIHDALGTWPRSVWSVVDEADRYPAWRHNPLVYVPK